MTSPFTESHLFPDWVKSRLDIIQHPIMWQPGGCLSTSRSPNGAYMWSKEMKGGIELVVVYLERDGIELIKVDEFTYRYKDLPPLSHPVGVEVDGDHITYYSGGNPVKPKRALFVRKCRKS